MAKKEKEYKVIKKRSAIFRFLCSIVKIFKRKPKITNLNEQLEKKAIYLMIHNGASGPFTFELFFPVKATPWGAHEMCGNYKMRWNYLYHVFYQQKLHWNKFCAFVVATLFAVISIHIYKAIGLIGTYTDYRMIAALKNSFKVLDEKSSIVIFPEDSNKGYFEKPTAFHNGFITLSTRYFKKTGEDVPVYNVYYSKRKNKIVIDKPLYINQLLKEGKSVEDVSNIFLKNCHLLADQVLNEEEKENK